MSFLGILIQVLFLIGLTALVNAYYDDPEGVGEYHHGLYHGHPGHYHGYHSHHHGHHGHYHRHHDHYHGPHHGIYGHYPEHYGYGHRHGHLDDYGGHEGHHIANYGAAAPANAAKGKVASRSVNKWDPEVETEEEFRNREGKRHHDGAFYPEPPKFLWGLLG